MAPNTFRPRPIESAPPGEVVDGVGGARKRWKKANFSTPFSPAGVVVTVVSVKSLGTVANWQAGLVSRSLWNTSFEIPISTLYASPEKISRDLFWAFHPNLVRVP